MSDYSIEAYKQSREFMAGNNESPTELEIVLGHMATQNFDALPCTGSAEAEEFVQRTKTERYAYLAAAIGLLLDKGFEISGEGSPYELPYDILNTTKPWDAVRMHFIVANYEISSKLSGTEEFQKAAQVSRLIGRLTPKRFIYLDTQLIAGTTTAMSTILPILRNLPKIGLYHSPDFDISLAPEVARRSPALAHELMKRSVASMMAARHALATDHNWSDESLINPTHFRPVFSRGKLHSLLYKDLENIEIGEDTEESVTKKLSELDHTGITVIGCPLSLLKGKYKQLWIRTVNSLERLELWSVDQDLEVFPQEPNASILDSTTA